MPRGTAIMRFALAQAIAFGSILAPALAPQAASATSDEPIKPLPPMAPQDPARVELGRRLFFDPRLSADGRVACASCHDPAHGGADGRARSPGFGGKTTAFNTPTVFNAALNFRQFWDGRADSLEAQVDAVIRNPVEMGSNWAEVQARIARDPVYRSDFARAYPAGVTPATIQNAIASYERTLLTPSRFDAWLRGDASAISAEEKAGYAKFKQFGCVACHQGVNVGGNMFQKFGVMGDWFARRPPSEADLGRFAVTGNEADRHVFRVPSLRNVALTAPYLHDGSARTLADAVEVMFRYQLGRHPAPADTASIVLFLRTLSDASRPAP